MAEFFELSHAERLEALNVAADASGIPPHLLEEDIRVVWSLRHLFTGPYATCLFSLFALRVGAASDLMKSTGYDGSFVVNQGHQ